MYNHPTTHLFGLLTPSLAFLRKWQKNSSISSSMSLVLPYVTLPNVCGCKVIVGVWCHCTVELVLKLMVRPGVEGGDGTRLKEVDGSDICCRFCRHRELNVPWAPEGLLKVEGHATQCLDLLVSGTITSSIFQVSFTYVFKQLFKVSKSVKQFEVGT